MKKIVFILSLLLCMTMFSGCWLLFLETGDGDIGTEQNTNNEETNEINSDAPITKETDNNFEFDIQFFLKAGEKGEYGQLLTYNAGTEFEETFYAYYVPYGKYLVSNAGNYPTQVNIYSDETQFVNGWEEPKYTKVYILQKQETKEIEVPEGYHIDIAKPTYVLMKKISDENDSSNNKTISYEIVDTYYRVGRSRYNSTNIWVACFSVVKNTGNTNLYLSSGTFDIKDKEGILLASEEITDIYPIVIAPNEIGVYYCETTFYRMASSESAYDFDIVPELEIKEATIPYVRLETSDINVKTNDIGDVLVTGKVKNTTNEEQSLYFVVAFLYNEDGKIIGVVDAMPDKIDPNETLAFTASNSLSYNLIKSSEIKSYDVISFPYQYQFD